MLPALQADDFQRLLRTRKALILGDALHLQPPCGVLLDRAMRQQSEVLEDHGRFGPAVVDELLLVVLENVLVVNDDLAECWLDQAGQDTDERRFAAAREPHHDERLADLHVEADVLQADHHILVLPQISLAPLEKVWGNLRRQVATEQLPETADAQSGLPMVFTDH